MSEERIKTKVPVGILKPAHQVFEAIVDPDIMNKYNINTSTGRMGSGKTSNEYKDACNFSFFSTLFYLTGNQSVSFFVAIKYLLCYLYGVIFDFNWFFNFEDKFDAIK